MSDNEFIKLIEISNYDDLVRIIRKSNEFNGSCDKFIFKVCKMLQILSGKFFNESIETKQIINKDIFYSNIKMFSKIETDFWTLESINMNSFNELWNQLDNDENKIF